MIWKDYIYFSRSERNGIKILSLLLIMIACAPVVIKHFRTEKPVDHQGFIDAVAAFNQQTNELTLPETTASHERVTTFETNIYAEVKLHPFRFNPNNLSVEEWEKMGLPTRLAHAIHNYLAAGGTFRVREDLQRIYLMQDEWYDQLEPYINLPSKDDQQAIASHANQYQQEERHTNPSPVDINRADTTELTRIRGIGPAYSRRIFGYRNLLGGFYHPDQLLEVYGMDSVRWEQLLPQAHIDTSAITKININQADYTTLLRHPYIDNNLAGALVNFRNQHSPLDSLAQIRESFLVTDEVFEKIAPYLKIE